MPCQCRCVVPATAWIRSCWRPVGSPEVPSACTAAASRAAAEPGGVGGADGQHRGGRPRRQHAGDQSPREHPPPSWQSWWPGLGGIGRAAVGSRNRRGAQRRRRELRPRALSRLFWWPLPPPPACRLACSMGAGVGVAGGRFEPVAWRDNVVTMMTAAEGGGGACPLVATEFKRHAASSSPSAHGCCLNARPARPAAAALHWPRGSCPAP